MFISKSLSSRLKSELCAIKTHLIQLLIYTTAGLALIISSFMKFGGPCKLSLFFNIPGGNATIVCYYILWTIMFGLFGGETAIICNVRKREGSAVLLLHIASHLCLFLWYPLFFTTFSQLLSLLILISAAVLLILEAKETCKLSALLTISLTIKIVISVIFAYINLSFIIIN